ncbi:hypothetical protein J6590_020609 [Homalodisca vitripennis]|nr:hypothetical protein J6590_020609 [Homalodisca vitripennis]
MTDEDVKGNKILTAKKTHSRHRAETSSVLKPVQSVHCCTVSNKGQLGRNNPLNPRPLPTLAVFCCNSFVKEASNVKIVST